MWLCVVVEKVETWTQDVFLVVFLLSLDWEWRTVVFQLSGFYCRGLATQGKKQEIIDTPPKSPKHILGP